MKFDLEDTIVAIATSSGGAPRGVVRVSGDESLALVQKVFAGDLDPSEFQTATMVKGEVNFRSMASKFSIGNATLTAPAQLLVWPNRKSYTAQPCAEIHTYGAYPLLENLVEQLCDHGARLARPGEFTLRAFMGGRLDLTQAEAVLAVIDADNDRQFSAALGQLAGGLAGPLGDVRKQLISLLADLEAGLDFVEEDINFISQDKLLAELNRSLEAVLRVVKQIETRDVSGTLQSVVLIGKPNAGKSQLFNTLCERERVIVTNVAGTTTDFVESTVDLNSQRVRLIDTAGEEEATGVISEEAQQVREEQTQKADLRLICVECRDQPDALAQKVFIGLEGVPLPSAVVLTKVDQISTSRRDELLSAVQSKLERSPFRNTPVVATSGKESIGVESLKSLVVSLLSDPDIASDSVVNSTVQRAAESLRSAHQCIKEAVEAAKHSLGDEIVAAEVRDALRCLSEVVGEVYTDDILDVVFGRFCIGK